MLKKQIQINNEKFFYIDEGVSENVLVLIHGNMSSSVHFKPIIERMKNDFRVIAIDMRGFGDSSYNKPIDSLNDFASDIINILDRLNISTYSLLGWSTGGAVAMKIASEKQNEVKKLILLESCSYKGYPIFKKDASMQPIIGESYLSKEEMALDPVQVKPMEDIFNLGNKIVMKAIWDQMIYTVNKPTNEDDELYLNETMKQRNIIDVDWGLVTFNMSDTSNGVTIGDNTIKNIICPTLSFYGDKDIVILEYMVDETVQAIENCTKVKLSNSGHSPLVDCPDELVNNITDFIK